MDAIENLSKYFFKYGDYNSMTNLVRHCRVNELYELGGYMGEFFTENFGKNMDLMDEWAMCMYYSHRYRESFDIYSRLLDLPQLDREQVEKYTHNQHFSSKKLTERYMDYDRFLINSITPNPYGLVTFSMTTCKRFDLFYRTMTSFVNCMLDRDMIKEWYIIDDHSSDEDINNMKTLFPFLTIIRKESSQKGHPQSMNIIRNLVKTPYLLHMEDDWVFFKPDHYIRKSLDVLSTNKKYGQCLFNINYAELPTDKIAGGVFKKTENQQSYYEHEYYSTIPAKYSGQSTCVYWPQFSLRPSITKTVVFQDIGEFNTTVSHFEMEYAYRYIAQDYISCFLPTICSKHIGRLTSERNDKTKINAYHLNGEIQFGEKSIPRIKNVVINLDRRQDRMTGFIKNLEREKIPMKFIKFSAIDGSRLKPTRQMFQIFDNNDYKYRRGMVGCALSHISLMIELLKDDENDCYLIVEDDIEFAKDFYNKYRTIYESVKNSDPNWGIIYLGHTARPRYREKAEERDKIPIVEKLSAAESIQKSMGGAFCYLINKNGALNVLKHITDTGMTNAVDTIQQLAGDKFGLYYAVPNIAFAKIAHESDIQNIFDNLYVEPEKRLQEDIELLNRENIRYTIEISPKYTGWWIDQKFISIHPMDVGRVKNIMYLDRLKKYNPHDGRYEYNIGDCLKYD